MFVSARERKLLEILLQAPIEVTIPEIAEELGVSSRTVHRDLKGIDTVLSEYGLALKKTAGKGILLGGSEADRSRLATAIHEQSSLDYTQEERHILILSWLLESNEPLKLHSIANDLGVTAATISHDLEKIEEVLERFQLLLIRRRGYGIEVSGEEGKIREAIQYIMMQHMDEHDFLRLLREQLAKGTSVKIDAVSNHLLGMVNKERIADIEQTIDLFRSRLPYPLADSAYIGLVIHLALAIERLEQGEFIEMEKEHLENLKHTKEYAIAEEMIQKLERYVGIRIPQTEIGYITMHLMGAKARYDEKEFYIEESSLSIAFKTKQLIEFVSKALNKDLHTSPKLLNDLVVHLKPSLYRIQHGMEIKNPLKDQIETDYRDLFLIVEEAVEHVFPDILFPKEETAFIVMHFASSLLSLEGQRKIRAVVVCSSGIGTAKILAAKLKRRFHEVDLVDHLSLFDLNEEVAEGYDMVVSTLPLRSLNEYLLVSPMLPSSDIHRIEHHIRKVLIKGSLHSMEKKKEVKQNQTLYAIKDSVNVLQRYVATISHLLNHLHVFPQTSSSKEGILTRVCHHLQMESALEEPDAVARLLLKREALGGIGVPETSIALFHTRSDLILKPSFTMVTLEKPMELEGMDGQPMEVCVFVLLLAPESLSKEALEVVSFLSTMLIDEEECVKVFHSKDESRMEQYVSNQLHKLMKEKLPS